MSEWTHPICDDCWDDENPTRPSPRRGEGDDENCCFCGLGTTSGIYVRKDPDEAPHHSYHGDE